MIKLTKQFGNVHNFWLGVGDLGGGDISFRTNPNPVVIKFDENLSWGGGWEAMNFYAFWGDFILWKRGVVQTFDKVIKGGGY